MIVDCAYYKDRKRQSEEPVALEQAVDFVKGNDGFVWLGLVEPTHQELVAASDAFDLPKLAVEDTVHAHQRPKLEDYEGHFFVVLKTARYDEAEEQVHFGEIHVFLGSGYAITVRHGEASELKPARERLEGKYAELLDAGPAAVAWAVLDQVVDDYEPVTAGIDDDIEEVEEEIRASGSTS
jgi:magnesium transporter